MQQNYIFPWDNVISEVSLTRRLVTTRLARANTLQNIGETRYKLEPAVWSTTDSVVLDRDGESLAARQGSKHKEIPINNGRDRLRANSAPKAPNFFEVWCLLRGQYI